MAIGLFNKEAPADNNSQNSDDKVINSEKGYKAAGGLEGGVTADSGSDSFDVGKQIAMEADNAIKYRTCSWPKVCFSAL